MMAFSIHLSSPTISYAILLVLILFTAPSSADLFGDVCSATLNQSLCLKVINSIPGAVKATDLKTLAQITIPYAVLNGANTQSYVKSLSSSATDYWLKEDYTTCYENYDVAVGDLEEAQSFLREGDYPTVAVRATGAMDQVETCEENFKDPPRTDPSQLPAKNEYFDTLCLIILVIANKLGGH